LFLEPDQSIVFLQESVVAFHPVLLASLGLAKREAEVLFWVMQRKPNAEIGSILVMSTRTVAKHLEHIYRKLGVATRSEATALAIRHLTLSDRSSK
jgi:DNA-binding CsgD family transcriptional regulator